MDYRTHDGRMIVGAHGNGVYSTQDSSGFCRYGVSDFYARYFTLSTFTNQCIHVSTRDGQE
ncbi:MAG: hypothetical protein IPM74_19275 [Crocinitomicaceae bacterium]|nr:hypothetical protein [Crocinitomicaceae bacterium]